MGEELYRGWRIYPSDRIAPDALAWTYCHDSYDGAPDARDNRIGRAATLEACRQEIDELEDQ